MGPRVTCIGAATIDTIVVAQLPLPTDARVEVESGVVAGGGPAATAAVALVKQGCRVAFVGRVGDDEAGRIVIRGLIDAGIDVSDVRVLDGVATAISAVVVDQGTGDRLILTRATPLPPIDISKIGLAALRDPDWIHVDHVGWPVVPSIRSLGITTPVSVDGGNAIAGLDLSQVAIYAPSESGLRIAAGQDDVEAAMHWALDRGAKLVVVTRGAAGSMAMGAFDLDAVDAQAHLRSEAALSGSRRTISEPAADWPVISTLGAGDVFHGLLLGAISDGLSVRHALRLANQGAAMSCAGLDGRSAIPGRHELLQALRATVPDDPAWSLDRMGQ